ncbi:hypothetical protein [Corynebacterium sp. A21]|uniref:hypothetical protein n=1 Tax=Corynebacterium sp. A21 TaxID=3457318 RepID=UPI003FD3C7A0
MKLTFNDNFGDRIKRGANLGARDGAAQVLGTSNDKAPLETGVLRASGKVSTDGKGTAAVSYNTPYAAKQHEEVGYHHTDGEAKYLENAMRDEAENVKRIIAERVRRMM